MYRLAIVQSKLEEVCKKAENGPVEVVTGSEIEANNLRWFFYRWRKSKRGTRSEPSLDCIVATIKGNTVTFQIDKNWANLTGGICEPSK